MTNKVAQQGYQGSKRGRSRHPVEVFLHRSVLQGGIFPLSMQGKISE